jgi:flavodoxin
VLEKMKALIAYYSTTEKEKPSNEDKVAWEFEKIFKEKKFAVTTLSLKPKKQISLAEQFKQEKELELENSIHSFDSFDLVFIGTPIVGSFTSAPAVNAFIRDLPKTSQIPKAKIILFSVGVLHGLELKKMQSLLSMKALKILEKHSFTSIFDFDEKKLAEIRPFVENILEKIK